MPIVVSHQIRKKEFGASIPNEARDVIRCLTPNPAHPAGFLYPKNSELAAAGEFAGEGHFER